MHHHIFDRVGIGNLSEDEAFFFGCGLDVDIAKIENGWNEAVDDGSHVLNPGKLEFADFAIEKAFLLYVDDAFVGDDPDIKVVVYPDEEYIQPDEKEESIEKEEKEKWRKRVSGDRRGFRKDGEDDDKEDRRASDADVLQDDIEPVTMDDTEYVLVFTLALKMVSGEGRYHKEAIKNRWIARMMRFRQGALREVGWKRVRC